MNLISILLTTFNGEKFLGAQLNSLFEQTNQNFQVLVRDDGSSDCTINIIEDFQSRFPNRIKLIIDKLGNIGSSESFMKLVEHSSSDYVMFCDQDDIWMPNKIELSLKKIRELEKCYGVNTPVLVFTDLKVVDSGLNIIEKSFWKFQKIIPEISFNWKKLLAQNVITGCTIILNNKSKDVILPFKLKMMIHDQWLGVNVAKYGKVEFLEETTLLYRQHAFNVAGAHNFGLKYIFKKVQNLRRIIIYFLAACSHFGEITIIELIIYKLKINLERYFKN